MTPARIRSKLLVVRRQIDRNEANLVALYAARVELLEEARKIDPVTKEAIVMWADLAEWSGITKVALYKAVRKSRDALAAGTPTRGRHR